MCSRKNAKQLVGIGTVNGIRGMILLPDAWELPSGVTFNSVSSKGMKDNVSNTGYQGEGNHGKDNSYTEAEWFVMESAGAVFLPEAGGRWGDKYSIGDNSYGEYWTSTSNIDEAISYSCDYWKEDDETVIATASGSRASGYSVRLVQ